ncbi:MAG: M20/M25/M40 family metallo-hydrolase [Clostridiales bacterium]|nr:M20/M25/M40 family metallo-hydrolase [Clostridiales bacterium]
MNIFLPILYALLALFGLIILIMIIKTVTLKPEKSEKSEEVTLYDFDENALAEHLSEAVKIPTVSMVEEYKNNSQPFFRFHRYLEETYPLIHKTAEKTIIADYSLVYRFKGENAENLPACFLAHMDVVPADDKNWTHPPFSGKIEDGFVYGRGAMDMKGHLIALMEAMEELLRQGVKFNRDIYFCFGHDEEPGNSFDGAPNIVKYFEEKGIKFEFVLDEGGTITDGRALGLKKQIALIGISEKGMGDIELSVEKPGGHASNPKAPTVVGTLCEAVSKLEKKPMRTRWTKATKNTVKILATHAKGPLKFVLANRAALSPLLKWAFTKISPMTNALVRTTFAPTMLWGSKARNVLPPIARANINTRIITGQTMDDVVKYIKKVVGKDVKVELQGYTNPTPEGDLSSFGYKSLIKTISELFPESAPVPYLFIAASDARFYFPLTNNVFRFGPFNVTLDEQKRIHGYDERLSIADLKKAAQFFARCIENTCVN